MPTVNQAMEVVSHTTLLPLAAPRYIPIADLKGHLYLAAQTTILRHSYHVHLQLTTKPLAVNNPAINAPVNTGLARYFGGFGARQYHTVSDAFSSLSHTLVKPASTAGKSIGLGNAMMGQIYNNPSTTLVQWKIGAWTFQWVGPPSGGEIYEAKRTVHYLQGQSLPATPGTVVVEVGGDGDHTVIHFQVGRLVFSVSNYHSTMGALEMLMAMKTWPSSQNLTGPH